MAGGEAHVKPLCRQVRICLELLQVCADWLSAGVVFSGSILYVALSSTLNNARISIYSMRLLAPSELWAGLKPVALESLWTGRIVEAGPRSRAETGIAPS